MMKPPWDNRRAWTLSILLGLAFVAVGGGKLAEADRFDGMFRQFGYPKPELMVYVTGTLEAGGGLLLFVPMLAPYGAIAVGTVMLAAITTHLVTGVGTPWAALVLFLIAAAFAKLRWPRRWRPAAASAPPHAV